MKNIFKNKKLLIILSSVLAICLVGIVVLSMALGNKSDLGTQPESTVSDETDKDIIIDKPKDNNLKADESNVVNEITDDGAGLKPDENIETSKSSNTGSKAQTEKKAESEAKEPDQSDTPAGGGVVIGDGGGNSKYSCGAANHHCEGAETHAYILNLELEGCQHCGSHSCKSFYTTDEWGNACPDATKCPKYNKENNILTKCPDCGRTPKDGTNGTCVQFLLACDCPNCGVHVEANTCHTCG